MNRKDTLLRAAYDILKQLDHGDEYERVTAAYDGTDCDGSCLLMDIAHELELPDGEDTEPLPAVRK